jgi:hypothetical protein
LNKKLVISFLALALCVALSGVCAFAQTATGEILGRVTDQQGAVIAGANVTVKETTTGRTRTTTTNNDGDYAFPLLPPGSYEVAVEAPSMSKGVATVQVLLGSHKDVNFNLKAQGAGTTVEVTGEAPLVETTNSELKTNIDTKQIETLPIQDRNFASLATLSPNIRPVGSFDPTKLRTGNVSANGNTGRGMNLTVDGGDNKDNVVGGFLQNYTTEGIQEFVVETHRFGADTGKSAGGVLTIATKGGTNTYHGSFFGFLRNKHIQAADYFTRNPNASATCPPCYEGPANEKPPFQRLNWGGSLGGPLIKDKWYFFGATEFAHENTSLTQSADAQETLAAFDALRTLVPVTNPIIQNAPIDPSSSVATPFRDSQWQLRSDWNINANNQLFARYGQQNNKVEGDQITGTSDPNEGASQTNDLHSVLANWAWTISPRALNQFVFQVSTFFNSIQARPGSAGVPNIFFANGIDFGQNGNVPQTTEQTKWQFRDDFSIRMGNHSLKFGAMQVVVPKFGGQFAFLQTPSFDLNCNPQDILATINFATPNDCNNATSLDDPGVVLDGFLAGGDAFFFQDTINQFSIYAQDDWKIHPRFTLNLGVRNDIDFGLVPTTDQQFNRTVVILNQLGIPTGTPETDKNNWAPRLGFAWDMTGSGKYVLRGGYGMFYDQLFQNVTLFAVQQANPNVYSTLVTKDYSGQPIGLSDAITDVGPFPVNTLTELPWGSTGRYIAENFQNPYSQQFSIGTQLQLGSNWVLNIDGIHVLSLHEFSQTEMNPDHLCTQVNCPVLTASSGARVMNLPGGGTYGLGGPGTGVNLYPGSVGMDAFFGCRDVTGAAVACDAVTAGVLHRLHSVRRAESNSRSRYDSLTIELKRRFANRFQFGASYVFSKARAMFGQAADFGNRSQGVCPGCVDPQQSAVVGTASPQNYGFSSEDERHRFVFNGILELPWGFRLSGVVQASSARPYTLVSGRDINGDGVNNDFYSNVVSGDPIFDPLGRGDARFAIGPNTLRGEPYYQTNIRVEDVISLGERFKLEVIADLFNIFNRDNFGDTYEGNMRSIGYGTTVPGAGNCATFGVTNCVYATDREQVRKQTGLFGGGFGGAGTIGIPFQAQLGLRLRF